MTRDEIAALFAGYSVDTVKPRQYEPPSFTVACPHCRTPFRLLYLEQAKPWFDRHVTACAKRSEPERKFYFAHRRWPRVVRRGCRL